MEEGKKVYEVTQRGLGEGFTKLKKLEIKP